MRRLFAACLLGAVSVAAFAPLGWFPIAWAALAGLFVLLNREADHSRSWRRGTLIGGAFGFGFFITGVSWVYVSLSTFGGMPPALAGVATLLFCAFLALYPAIAGGVFVRHSPAHWWQRGLLFAALLTLTEWLRGWIFTGFPWLAFGYSQTPPSPLAGYIPLFGVFGASLLTQLVGAFLGESASRAVGFLRARGSARAAAAVPLPPLLLTLALLAGGWLLHEVRWTTPDGSPIRVALLQGNVAQDLKWRPEKFIESLRTYYRLAKDNPAQLTVLPETAVPTFLDDVPREYLDEIRKLAEREQGDLIFGIVIGNDQEYANGAVSLGVSPEQRYRKSHLVPFGEFIPPGFSWFLKLANIPMSSFTPGASPQRPMSLGGQQVAVNICYEDAFGEEIIRNLPDATLLVNISNVAWFGDSLAPAQHLQIARIRALETGRMMLRATNTGMTAIIDARGEVKNVLPPFTRGALRGEVVGHTGATPYVRWGNWPTILFTLTVLLWSLAVFRKRKAVS
ncbi:MAG: apolipoprotein N-acyltransferase [Propionivibrio sp.]